MTLIARMSVVKCDFCGQEATLHHEIEYEADAGYPFNKALDAAGWTEPYIGKADYPSYGHRCPSCTQAQTRWMRKSSG